MTSAEAESLLFRLQDAFDKEPSPKRRAVYVERLEAFDYESARRAVNRLIDTDKYFPSVSAVVTACQAVATQQPAHRNPQSTRILTPSEVAAMRERMWDRVYRMFPQDIIDEALSDRYMVGQRHRCEAELDWMASAGYEPTLEQVHSALVNYSTVLVTMCAWVTDRTHPEPPAPRQRDCASVGEIVGR